MVKMFISVFLSKSDLKTKTSFLPSNTFADS